MIHCYVVDCVDLRAVKSFSDLIDGNEVHFSCHLWHWICS